MRDQAKDVSVLIAEDDDDDYFLTEKAFRDCQFSGRVLRVKDGEELMSVLLKGSLPNGALSETPFLLILDLNMPRKDGREALEEVKAHPALRKIPVIVLTTSMSEEDMSASYGLGANAFIRKPESFDKFVDCIGALKKFWLEVAVLPSLSDAPSVP